MRHLALPLILMTLLIGASGCALSPEEVFVRSTNAFAEGKVDEGLSYCSERFKATRSRLDLELYYAQEAHRRGMAYLLSNVTFQILEEDPDRATARVVWSTGLMENAYFVREDGRWRIDLPPAPEPVQ